jgi:hypothetical protein
LYLQIPCPFFVRYLITQQLWSLKTRNIIAPALLRELQDRRRAQAP